MYSQNVIDIFQKPKNAGIIRGADAIGSVGNASCGDVMKLYLKIENETIADAKFKTFGCVSAIASCEVACDLIKGKTIEQALKVTNKDVLDVLGQIPAQKIHCSVMAQEAIESAIRDFNKRRGIVTPKPVKEKPAKAEKEKPLRTPRANALPAIKGESHFPTIQNPAPIVTTSNNLWLLQPNKTSWKSRTNP